MMMVFSAPLPWKRDRWRLLIYILVQFSSPYQCSIHLSIKHNKEVEEWIDDKHSCQMMTWHTLGICTFPISTLLKSCFVNKPFFDNLANRNLLKSIKIALKGQKSAHDTLAFNSMISIHNIEQKFKKWKRGLLF